MFAVLVLFKRNSGLTEWSPSTECSHKLILSGLILHFKMEDLYFTMFEMEERTKLLLEAEGLTVALINPRIIKPMDTAVIEEYARKCRVVCTLEDHVMLHGFGAAVIDHLHTVGIQTPVERIAWPDEFIEHGKPDILRSLHGLTAEAAVEKVTSRLR